MAEYYIRTRIGPYAKKVAGHAVKLPHRVKAFVHESIEPSIYAYTVSECSTGVAIKSGDTKKAAIEKEKK